jgi:hypothetical protein
LFFSFDRRGRLLDSSQSPFWTKKLKRLTGILILVFASSELHAASVQRRAEVVTIEGRLSRGDHLRFEEALKDAGVKLIALDSGGGDIYTAFRIARLVRRLGLSTFLDASKARCQSACTLIFAAGIERYYVNGENLSDGVRERSRFGLGYHRGNSRSPNGGRNQSDRATQKMISGFNEFGSVFAAEFVERAQSNEIYVVSGTTALARGLSTESVCTKVTSCRGSQLR